MSIHDSLRAANEVYKEATKIVNRCRYALEVFTKGTGIKPNKFFMYENDLIKLKYAHELMTTRSAGKDILFNIEIMPIKQNKIYCAYVLEVNDYEA